MKWCDGPRITFISAFSFAEDTGYHLFATVVCHWVDILSSHGHWFHLLFFCLFLSEFHYFWPFSKEWDAKQHAPSRYCLSTVWYVEWTSHVALMRYPGTSLSVIVLVMLTLVVWSIVMIVWCTYLSISFVCWLLTWIGLRFRQYESQGSQSEVWTHFHSRR